MRIDRWLNKHTASLSGKTVAISGSTGGLGRELCAYLCDLGADLVLVDRNPELSERHKRELEGRRNGINVKCVNAQLDDPDSVRRAADELRLLCIDVFISNAGAYSIPRKICKNRYDNVFQINFIAPYTIIDAIMPSLRERGGRVVIVGSVAHRYSRSDPSDIDFSTRRGSAKVYGNSKRYLMFTLTELFLREKGVGFAVTHPGITFTNITAHYPKWIFAIIKHPMKIIFPKPRQACLSVLRGVFEDAGDYTWIGPSILDVWGKPKKRRLKISEREKKYFAKWSAECTEDKTYAEKSLS